MKSEDVAVVDEMLRRLRAHGLAPQRIEIPGVVTMDLMQSAPDQLSPAERDITEQRGSRGIRVLGLPPREG